LVVVGVRGAGWSWGRLRVGTGFLGAADGARAKEQYE
jgi:hypothetical protein